MPAEVRSCDFVELRNAREPDLPEVLALLKREDLPAAGVAEALPHFVVAEHEGKLVGAAGLEIFSASALLRSVVVDESWRGTSEAVTEEVRGSVEFRGACPSSAVVMRKRLRGEGA